MKRVIKRILILSFSLLTPSILFAQPLETQGGISSGYSINISGDLSSGRVPGDISSG